MENDLILGQPSLGYIFHVPESYWKLAIVKPVHEATAAATYLVESMILKLGILIFILTGLGYFVLRRYLVRPILDVAQSVAYVDSLIAEGRMSEFKNLKSENHSKDEIGVVSQFFETLSKSFASSQEIIEEQKRKVEVASEAKSNFLASMGHELKTPLNAIMGFADLLSNHPEKFSQEQLKERIKHIQNAGNGLLELINQVLNFQKIDAGKFQPDIVPLEVASLIRESIKLLNSLANKHDVRLVDEIKEEAFALGDNDSLKQVLFNLISNAIKYNKKGE